MNITQIPILLMTVKGSNFPGPFPWKKNRWAKPLPTITRS